MNNEHKKHPVAKNFGGSKLLTTINDMKVGESIEGQAKNRMYACAMYKRQSVFMTYEQGEGVAVW